MQVTILAGFAGEPFSPGEVVDLPADRVKQLIAEGRAEPVPQRLEVTDGKSRRRPTPKE